MGVESARGVTSYALSSQLIMIVFENQLVLPVKGLKKKETLKYLRNHLFLRTRYLRAAYVI